MLKKQSGKNSQSQAIFISGTLNCKQKNTDFGHTQAQYNKRTLQCVRTLLLAHECVLTSRLEEN